MRRRREHPWLKRVCTFRCFCVLLEFHFHPRELDFPPYRTALTTHARARTHARTSTVNPQNFYFYSEKPIRATILARGYPRENFTESRLSFSVVIGSRRADSPGDP